MALRELRPFEWPGANSSINTSTFDSVFFAPPFGDLTEVEVEDEELEDHGGYYLSECDDDDDDEDAEYDSSSTPLEVFTPDGESDIVFRRSTECSDISPQLLYSALETADASGHDHVADIDMAIPTEIVFAQYGSQSSRPGIREPFCLVEHSPRPHKPSDLISALERFETQASKDLQTRLAQAEPHCQSCTCYQHVEITVEREHESSKTGLSSGFSFNESKFGVGSQSAFTMPTLSYNPSYTLSPANYCQPYIACATEANVATGTLNKIPGVDATYANSLWLDLALSPKESSFGITSTTGMLPTHRPRPQSLATPKPSHNVLFSANIDYNLLSDLDVIDDGKRYLAPERVAISRPAAYTGAPKQTSVPLPSFKLFLNQDTMTWELPPLNTITANTPPSQVHGGYALLPQSPTSHVFANEEHPFIAPLNLHANANVATHDVAPMSTKASSENNLPSLKQFLSGIDSLFLNNLSSVQAPSSVPATKTETRGPYTLPARFVKNRARFGPHTTAMDLVRDYLLPPSTPDATAHHVGCVGDCSECYVSDVAPGGRYGNKMATSTTGFESV